MNYVKEGILAIIPARSGSKGLKDKNIKILNGKPLIAYTIEAALKSGVFDDVIVSTDSEKYKKISEEYGAYVPFLRSQELSRDTTSTNDVIEDLILKLKDMGREYDSFMILQPTSPLRDEKDIVNAVEIFMDKKANSVVSMCECEHSPLLAKELDENLCLDGFLADVQTRRRQEFSKFYRLNGAIYLIQIEYFLKYKDYYKENSYAYIMDKRKSIDIDDIYDFEFAEVLIRNKYN